MTALIALLTISASLITTRAAIIEEDGRMSAGEFSAEPAGCTAQSPELQLARACYLGGMKAPSEIKFVGSVESNKLSYCYNALVIPSTSGARSELQVLTDNKGGNLRAQNFVVPQGPTGPGGKAVIVGGVEGKCLTKTTIDGVNCDGPRPLKVNYLGTPGSEISIDSLTPGAAGARVNAANDNLDSAKVASTLLADVGRRLTSASAALATERPSPRDRGRGSPVVTQQARAIRECAAAEAKYRSKKNLVTPESDARIQGILDGVARANVRSPLEVTPHKSDGAGSAN